MKNMKLIVIASLASSAILTACGGGNNNGGNNNDPNIGFNAKPVAIDSATGIRLQTAGVIGARLVSSGSSTVGSIDLFSKTTAGGAIKLEGAIVPGRWELKLNRRPISFPMPTEGEDFCTAIRTDSIVREVTAAKGSNEEAQCFSGAPVFIAAPSNIDVQNQPSSIQLNGNKGLELIYGLPIVVAYDEYGNVVGSTSSSPLYQGGVLEGLIVPLPDLSNAYDGTYTLAIYNATGGGGSELAGATVITIYGNPVVIDPDPGDGGCPQSPPNQPQLPCYDL